MQTSEIKTDNSRGQSGDTKQETKLNVACAKHFGDSIDALFNCFLVVSIAFLCYVANEAIFY